MSETTMVDARGAEYVAAWHVTGAIERGEAVPIVEVPVKRYPEHNNDIGDWCPWSEEPRKGDDTRCPAGCRASDTGDWDDGENENVTVTPPAVPVEYYAGYPGKEGKA